MDSTEEAYRSDTNSKKQKSFLGIRSNRLIFFICLLIASSFWLLIKLSNVYSVEYSFRVTYNTPPSSLRLTKIIDSTLELRLTARGFNILKLNMFNDMETLDINLGNYEIDDRGNSKYAIYTQELVTTLSELVNVDEKDIQLSRTALLFEMEKTGEKKVAVIPDFSINFSGQYDLYKDVSITPADITVYGPQNALDSLLFIKTIKVEMENINSDVEIKVELFNPFPQLLTFETNEITLKIEVEKFTESELVVPINLSGMNYHVKTFPSQVTVYYKVAQKDFNDVRPHQFNIIPVIDDLNITNAKKLPLRIENHSDFARNIRIVPTEVEFLIIK